MLLVEGHSAVSTLCLEVKKESKKAQQQNTRPLTIVRGTDVNGLAASLHLVENYMRFRHLMKAYLFE